MSDVEGGGGGYTFKIFSKFSFYSILLHSRSGFLHLNDHLSDLYDVLCSSAVENMHVGEASWY